MAKSIGVPETSWGKWVKKARESGRVPDTWAVDDEYSGTFMFAQEERRTEQGDHDGSSDGRPGGDGHRVADQRERSRRRHPGTGSEEHRGEQPETEPPPGSGSSLKCSGLRNAAPDVRIGPASSTAVFVDRCGEPRVKRFSGNLLTTAGAFEQTDYVGPTWHYSWSAAITYMPRP